MLPQVPARKAGETPDALELRSAVAMMRNSVVNVTRCCNVNVFVAIQKSPCFLRTVPCHSLLTCSSFYIVQAAAGNMLSSCSGTDRHPVTLEQCFLLWVWLKEMTETRKPTSRDTDFTRLQNFASMPLASLQLPVPVRGDGSDPRVLRGKAHTFWQSSTHFLGRLASVECSEAVEPCTSDAARNAPSAASGGNLTQ